MRLLGVMAGDCVAVEDSDAGIRSAHGAGLHVIAIPNRAFPPAQESLDLAALTLPAIAALDEAAVAVARSARP